MPGGKFRQRWNFALQGGTFPPHSWWWRADFHVRRDFRAAESADARDAGGWSPDTGHATPTRNGHAERKVSAKVGFCPPCGWWADFHVRRDFSAGGGIADGLALGFISHPIVTLCSGNWRQAGWLSYALGAVLPLYFLLVRVVV